jgi:hypothetical protein
MRARSDLQCDASFSFQRIGATTFFEIYFAFALILGRFNWTGPNKILSAGYELDVFDSMLNYRPTAQIL